MDIIKNGTEEEQRRLIDDIAKRLETKKYGLVWEHGGDDENSAFEAEYVVAECSSGIPYPIYREDLSVSPEIADGNLLLEGDNYVWLKVLEQTHKGLVDVVYIDPPYNTGKKDFIYNDRFVSADDVYKHSMWLDFMSKRMSIARRILADDGVIFISCDDREQAVLKLLTDDVFGPTNFIAEIIRNTNSTKSNSLFISVSHEYCLVYAKNMDTLKKKHENAKWEVDKNNVDEYIKRIEQLKKKGLSNEEITAELKELTKYPRFIDFTNYWYVDERGVYMKDNMGGVSNGNMKPIINPLTGKEDPIPPGGYRYTPEYIAELMEQNLIHFHTDGSLPRIKRYLMDYKKQRPKSIMSDDQRPDNTMLEDMGLDFDNPKQLSFMKRILSIFADDAVFLDFFAGSGTTAHAIEELNKEDGGHRRWILITSNEDQDEDDGNPETGICRNITKPRIDMAISGERPHGTDGEATESGYAYYQYDFLPRTPYRDKNTRSFQRPAVLDPFVAIKYGAHKIATDEETMAYVYQGKDNIIVLTFGQATRKDIDQTLEGLDIDETLPVVAIVPDGCPLDMKHQDDLEVIPFSKLTDNSYLQGRK